MATTALFHSAQDNERPTTRSWSSARLLLVFSTLPLGLFGILHLAAEAAGMLPLFFTPFGLPAWTGAATHLLQLALIGAAYWSVTQRNASASARLWILALGAVYMALPFITPYLDTVQIALTCTAVLLVAAATMIRAGKVSPMAAWLLTPTFAVIGLSAAMGLAIAAYAPPFALLQTQNTPPAA
ncbi:hypothetical protein SAMN06295905_2375 [Devosia lucknowensis]|uniref:TspO and MBR related proteins n=1 Tax=Devosia lucknowensis TaxID=1096929 RepID=A0A1Y6FLS6_9HYPH|nr:hypothetical protein [Devosia lucknowensis]SMQ75667.1 hypothetical protein SAMN06295905_2375 [Devosia lucknowensis]